MKWINSYIRFVESILPSPFSIAVMLSLITFTISYVFTIPSGIPVFSYGVDLLGFWQKGFWELLAFTMQMSLILLLGHTLALSQLAKKLIDSLTNYTTTTAKAGFITSLTVVMLSFINWGLCLVFGAILARKIGEKCREKGIKINYALIGAAAYTGMLSWHAGLSASAPLTVAEENHFLAAKMGSIGLNETVLSLHNLVTFCIILIVIPILFYFLGKYIPHSNHILPTQIEKEKQEEKTKKLSNAERIEHNRWIALLFGGLLVLSACLFAWNNYSNQQHFIDLNFVNYCLFGLSILLHGSFHRFLKAVQLAIGDISGIVIQFPIYAGIMGLMKYSGLISIISAFFIQISTQDSLALFSFISAAIVNTFVPSGGGQWAVQGPILIEAAQQLNVPLAKIVMSLAYGDQITNMLQPFWALPLLGITQLKAKDIIAYTTLAMLVAGIVYLISIWLW